ncbi:MAG: methyltransferase domain-containing protein [Chloroflexota bacterium]
MQTLSERLQALLMHLNISPDQPAHIAARMPQDWHPLLMDHGQAQSSSIASMTLVCPAFLPTEGLAQFAKHHANRTVVYASAMPQYGGAIDTALADVSAVEQVHLSDYETRLWTDVIVDHGKLILSRLLAMQQDTSNAGYTPPDVEGEIAGIAYEVHDQTNGLGEPLILMPMGLSPAAWEPLLPQLSQHFCTIVLGGAYLGMMPVLELRGLAAGHQKMMSNLFEMIALQAGEHVLDIGSGSGVIDRWLAEVTAGANPITGMDLNDYLLKEATALVRRAVDAGELPDVITFTKGNAEELPFPDNYFDVTFSTTVMEEVDADQMLREMIRVTKPGGRVAVFVRAMDMAFTLNMPVREELRLRYTTPQWNSTSPDGNNQEGKTCATASLYRRFQAQVSAGNLSDLQFGPQLSTFYEPFGVVEQFLLAGFANNLSDEDAAEWRAAMQQAADDGTFFLAWPHHCAVGTVVGE